MMDGWMEHWLTIRDLALSSLDANLHNGADDGAVGAPLTDHIHDPVCDFLDKGQTSPVFICFLKHPAK